MNKYEQIDAKMELSETISRNRNVPYRVFRTEEDAARWLEDDDAAMADLHTSEG